MVGKKETKKNLNNKRNELFNMWKTSWEISNETVQSKYFKELFEESYHKIVDSKEINKKRNYWWKRVFIVNMAIGGFGILGFFIWHMYAKTPIKTATWSITVILLLFTISGIVILKWIDIKKFQETWARHSLHQQQIENEMLKFVSGMAPYNKGNKKKMFAKRIMVIWGKDQKKFNWNMEEKEKGLADALKYWKMK